MNPVQSQPIGQYFLGSPALPGAGQPTAPTTLPAAQATYLQNSPSIDGVQPSWSQRSPLPSPIGGAPNPNSPDPNQNPPSSPTSGSTGNSFLDLISQLMNQLDSVINGLAGGTTGSTGGTGSTPPPVCSAPLQPDPGTPISPSDPGISQTNPGGSAMRQLLATGNVS